MSSINVHLDFGDEDIRVGRLYFSEDSGRYIFSYDPEFIAYKLEISPFHLNTEKRMYSALRREALYYLHGVFADSLPDRWGCMVQDAQFETIGITSPTALDRLAFVGSNGIGALSYRPARTFPGGGKITGLAEIRKATQRIIKGDVEEVSNQLFKCGGSAGGARPKYLVDMKESDHEKLRYTQGRRADGYVPVVLKVPAKDDDRYQKIEYIHSQIARNAGLDIPKTHLIRGRESELCFFAIERFDILPDGGRYHVHTLAGISDTDFTDRNHSASEFLGTIERLTREHGQVVEGYRRVVFNYVGSNCDDHTKNFSFLMDRKGKWTLAPAYDIGYSKSAHDQHYMSVVSTRSKATAKDFEDLAASFNIVDWKNMVQEILFAFEKWPVMARELEVPEKNIREIGGKIMENARIIRKGL